MYQSAPFQVESIYDSILSITDRHLLLVLSSAHYSIHKITFVPLVRSVRFFMSFPRVGKDEKVIAIERILGLPSSAYTTLIKSLRYHLFRLSLDLFLLHRDRRVNITDYRHRLYGRSLHSNQDQSSGYYVIRIQPMIHLRLP